MIVRYEVNNERLKTTKSHFTHFLVGKRGVSSIDGVELRSDYLTMYAGTCMSQDRIVRKSQ
jgi:hypothetical protein